MTAPEMSARIDRRSFFGGVAARVRGATALASEDSAFVAIEEYAKASAALDEAESGP